MTMKCAKAKKYISEYIDGDLSRNKASSLEKHLKACPDCQSQLEDFQQIKERAGRLLKSEPSGQTWFRIQARLKENTQVSSTGPKVRFLFFPARLRYAVSAALLLFVVIGGIVIGVRIWDRRGIVYDGSNGQEYALAKIREAEEYYKLAIKALWEAVQAQKENFDPQVAETFRVNLELINASLADCKRAIENDPRDLESQYYLLAVYKKKAELLDNMIEVSSAQPQMKESRSTIF
jgi:tetratricopeptide (TPR) repeat protein